MSWPGRRLLVNFVSSGAGRGTPSQLQREGTDQGFQPPTDLYETPDALVVRVEIAGMTGDEIDISLDEGAGRLVISGRRPDPAASEHRRYFNVEIETGEFVRAVQIPRPVNVEAAEASYDRGFLVVRLPLRSPRSGGPRNVPIG